MRSKNSFVYIQKNFLNALAIFWAIYQNQIRD